jgi:hypothetical protein
MQSIYNRPRSINIFLLDGNPEGIRVAQIAMSTIQAIAFHRSQIGRVRKEFHEIERPGVYLLLGVDEDDPDRRVGYVGESENVAKRLQYHAGNEKGKESKTFWTDTIALISKDENLTKSHARYVEAKLIRAGNANTRWKLSNGNQTGEEGKLPAPDRAAMDEFIEQARTLVGAMGCDLFKPRSGQLAVTASTPETAAQPAQSATFTYTGEGCMATAVVSSGDLVVLKGSIARLIQAGALPNGAKKLREQMLADRVLEQTSDGLLFTADRQFDSPSMAASVVSGNSVNGRTAWRLKNGTTYADWETVQNGAAASPDETSAQVELSPETSN